jgi:small-conductance mechanosensitive channel
MIFADLLDSASETLGGFLPRLAGALVLLIVGWIVVALIRRALAKVLHAAGVDEAGERWGAADVLERFGLGRSLAAVLAGAIRVGLLLVVIFAALSLLGLQFLSASLNAAILYLPRVLVAFLLLLAGMVISEFVRRQVDRLAAQMDIPGPLGGLAQAIVLAIFVVTALAQLGVPTQILLVLVSVLLAAAAATLALAFGIGGREMAREVSARRYVEGAYRIGQEITVSDVRGTITAIEATGTLLETAGGEHVRVPNSQLIARVVHLHGGVDTPS